MATRFKKEDRELLKHIKHVYTSYETDKQAEIESIIDIEPLIDFDGDIADTQKVAKFMIDSVKQLIEENDSSIGKLKELLSIAKLPDEIKELLEQVGDNPIKEPEIAKFKDFVEMIPYLNERFNIKLEEYNFTIQQLFLEDVLHKVVGFKDKDGYMKYTDLTKQMGQIGWKEREEIAKIFLKFTKSNIDFTRDDYNEQLKQKDKELTDSIIKVLSRSRKGLFKKASDWEKKLMAVEAQTQISDPKKSANMGFFLK